MAEHKPPRPYERLSSDLVLDPRLREADFQVLLALEMKAGESRHAICTIEWIEEQTGRCRRTVYYALGKAQELGYVTGRAKDEKGRLRLDLRRIQPSWAFAYRWMVYRPDWEFWKKRAFLAVQADHRAGGGHHLRLFGRKLQGLISLCNVRRYCGGTWQGENYLGSDWKGARRLVTDFLRELRSLCLIGLASPASGLAPAVCAVNYRRMASLAQEHPLPKQGQEDGPCATGADGRGSSRATGADVVGEETSSSSSPGRDQRSLPLRLTPQAREGAIAVRGEAEDREGAGGGEEAGDATTPASLGRPCRREGISEAAGPPLPASGPAASSEGRERPEDAQDALPHAVLLLRDLESRCGLVRSKNLDRFGEEEGYGYLAGAFLEMAGGFPGGWTVNDIAEGVRRVIPGLCEPSWGLLLLAARKGESGRAGFQFRGRLVEQVKEVTMHRQCQEAREAARDDPSCQVDEWLERGHVLLSQVARDNPSLRGPWEWFAALAVELSPGCASAHERQGKEVTCWAIDLRKLSGQQKDALKARYGQWFAVQANPS